MKPDNKAGGPWLYALGLIPVVWFALLIAPSLSGGLSEIVNALPAAMNHPFQIVWCEDSIKAVLIFIAAYGLGIGIYLSSRRNYRRGEEHGSAKWGDPRAVNKKYRDKDPFQNRIFTQHVRMGLDGKKHRRTLNSLVCGGSGAGKSRFYAKPNLLQASHVSYFVLDCKGELLRDCGGLLERMGYEIKVVDLLNMEKSHCYNPFAYLKNDNDVQKMVTNLFKSTTPKGSQSNDPFWDTAASMLLMALVFYLHYEAPEDEKNFAMIMEMLRAGEVREDDDSYQSPLDELFERLEMRSPDHIAVKYYKDYRSGSAKTLKSIQITLAARLEKFNLSSVAALTATDELDLASLGEKKVALFALIPDNDSSFNFLVSTPAPSRSCFTAPTGCMAAACQCRCISSWTSLPTSACRTTSTSYWPPCGAGTFRCPSSSRTSPSSRRCMKNNGNPSWATATSFCTWAATKPAPTS